MQLRPTVKTYLNLKNTSNLSKLNLSDPFNRMRIEQFYYVSRQKQLQQFNSTPFIFGKRILKNQNKEKTIKKMSSDINSISYLFDKSYKSYIYRCFEIDSDHDTIMFRTWLNIDCDQFRTLTLIEQAKFKPKIENIYEELCSENHYYLKYINSSRWYPQTSDFDDFEIKEKLIQSLTYEPIKLTIE
jgi:hypothetical protein